MAEKFFGDLCTAECSKDLDFNKWLLNQFNNISSTCSIEEFAAFYLNLVKSQTDDFLKNNTSTCNTPKKITATGTIDLPADDSFRSVINDRKTFFGNDSLRAKVSDEAKEDQTNRRQASRELFIKQKKHSPNLDKTFDSPTQILSHKSGPVGSSTPVTSFSKSNRSIDGNTLTPQSFKNTRDSTSFNDQSDKVLKNTSRNSLDLSGKSNSTNRRNTSSPFCLGDFINTSNVSSSGKGNRKKNTSQNSNQSQSLTLNNSDFPSLVDSPNEPKPQTKKKENKPKKRVLPITISRKTTPGEPNFTSSSFKNDNNLLNLTPSESDDVDILSERWKLSDERDAVAKDFKTEQEPQRSLHAMVRANLPANAQAVGSPRKVSSFQFDDSRVERKEILTTMAKIYSFLLDMNLVPNILSEFSYLFNLLNTDQELLDQLQPQSSSQYKSSVDVASNLLRNLHNCIFFTVLVLNRQKNNLALLDVMTLRVLIDNVRIQRLATELFNYMRLVIQRKTQLDSINKNISKSGSSVNKVVFFQQETDNRDNFPSDREFGAFKKQRDMFYTILRTWELKHLDQSWDFNSKLGMKVKSLITLMEHPINMAHLAKLFTAQLIISCNFDNSADELQMVLPNLDLSKLSKFNQRFDAPSQFSTQYLFPGNQAFFRDFIMCCDNFSIFMEQLKIFLISELMAINDSSLETLCIAPGNEDDNSETSSRQEFIVRAEMMTTMRVLAKFVGYVSSRPHSYDGYRNPLVDQKQLQIRNTLQPDFDVKKVVLRAIDGRKLLVTIPWLVEYLVMLDFITIRLDYYRDLFHLLCTVYVKVNVVTDRGSLCVMPTSKFIIRACLGWLFEHPKIPEEYYNHNSLKPVLKEIELSSEVQIGSELNPHLETILNSACPFLADFRVSMMPQQTTKAVSRSGRYRKITTKIQDKTFQNTKVQDNRERLIEAFLASQTSSVRKTVDFTIDRVTSAVVKDFQVKHLITARKEAKAEVEQFVSWVITTENLVKKTIESYKNHLKSLEEHWYEEVKHQSLKRIEGSFDSLLPIEALPDVKKTLVNITFEKTSEKLHEWFSTNITSIEIFSKDIQADATKMIENYQQGGNKRTTSNIVIDLSTAIMPSDFFKEFQTMLHNCSRHPERINREVLVNLIEMASDVLEKQTLPSNAYRNIAFYILQLLLQCIVARVDLITKDVLEKIYVVWRSEKLNFFTSKRQDECNSARIKVNDFIFSNVISSRFILTMQGQSRQSFVVYGDFLVDLVKQNFITLDDINEQSVRLYKHEWSSESLNDIAFLMQHVKSLLSSSSTPSESQLFMELCVDLAKDMENF